MRTFKKVFKIAMLEELQYKMSYISGIICQIAFGFLYIMLYQTFFDNGVPQNFSLQQMSSYVWLGQIFFACMCFVDVCKKEITAPIVNGDVGYQMVKPVNIYAYWFMQVFSKPTCAAIMRGAPLFIFAVLLPKGYGISLPASPLSAVLFVLAMLLGIVLLTALRMWCYYLVLFTMDSRGVFFTVGAFFSLLSGAVIPIPLMPDGVQKVLDFMPFRYVNDMPYRVYMGNIGLTSAIIQIGIQLVWIVVLVAVGAVLINKKSQKLVVQGG